MLWIEIDNKKEKNKQNIRVISAKRKEVEKKIVKKEIEKKIERV